MILFGFIRKSAWCRWRVIVRPLLTFKFTLTVVPFLRLLLMVQFRCRGTARSSPVPF